MRHTFGRFVLFRGFAFRFRTEKTPLIFGLVVKPKANIRLVQPAEFYLVSRDANRVVNQMFLVIRIIDSKLYTSMTEMSTVSLRE